MNRKLTLVKLIPLFAAGLILALFGLGLRARAQSPEETPVPTVVGVSPSGEPVPLEPESRPAVSGQAANPLETYLGPEGELRAAGGQTLAAAAAPMPGDYFLTISASNFPPRESAATNAYGGAGCSSRTSAYGYFSYPLILPDGVVIRGIRASYYDSSAANGSVYLYRFYLVGSTPTYGLLATTTTTGASGFGVADSPVFSHTVDTRTEALALILDYSNVNDSSLQFCNITVSYSARLNLPVVVK
jgi:hypothetical protein